MPAESEWVETVQRLQADADPELWHQMVFDLMTSAMVLDVVLDTLATRDDLSNEQRNGLLTIGVHAVKRHRDQMDVLVNPRRAAR